MESWIQLLQMGCLEIQINIEESYDRLVSKLDKEQIRKIKNGLQIVINDELFGMDLFRYLLMLKEVLKETYLKIDDERVKKIVEEQKQTIEQLDGQLGGYECVDSHRQYEDYYKME